MEKKKLLKNKIVDTLPVLYLETLFSESRWGLPMQETLRY